MLRLMPGATLKHTIATFILTLCLSLPTTSGAGENTSADEVKQLSIIDVQAPVVDTVGSLAFRECTLSAHGRDRKVQCAWFDVAENPDDPAGKNISLLVVRLPAKRPSKNTQDPLLLISGGPGQAASATFLFADFMWSALANKRDFYLVDQRGTGHSNRMACDDSLSEPKLVNEIYNPELIKNLTHACLKELPGDPRFYTTDIAVDDFDKVRQALKIAQWNLFGVSYGTRVATHYMRKYPAGIRSVILDSVVPPQHVLGSEIALRSQDMLDTLLQRCAETTECAEAMPNLKAEVEKLLTRLKNAPVDIQVENFRTGAIEELQFTQHHLTTLIRLYLYQPQTLAILPPMLHEAAVNHNFSPIARAAISTTEQITSSIAMGMHNSIMCTEEIPFQQLTDTEIAANEQTYLGTGIINLLADVCSVWPRGYAPKNLKEPLVSDIPTLLLSGEFDPITPPSFAELTQQHLRKSKHLMLPGQGHFVGGVGCMPSLIEQFVNDKSAETLDEKCLTRVHTNPIFLNFNSAAP